MVKPINHILYFFREPACSFDNPSIHKPSPLEDSDSSQCSHGPSIEGSILYKGP